MSYIIIYYSICFFVIVFIYWFLVPEKWRSLFLLLCSLIFISIFSIIYTFYFILLSVLVYWAGILIKKKVEKKRVIFTVTLVVLIGNLLLHKYFFMTIPESTPPLLNQATKILWPLGISYITFRLIHYIAELYWRSMPSSSFVNFALYVIFFPTFLAGPVERFQKFHAQTIKKMCIDITEMNYGLVRILFGIIKKALIADNLNILIMPVLHSPKTFTLSAVILSVYGLAIQIYMDFSAYSDMAIGAARLFGYKIVENFNYPYFKKNIALFWRSWHISVYSWIRDYFFFPLFGTHSSHFKLYFGIMVTMIVFHLWHIPSIGFFILGMYHGIGLISWRLFQEAQKNYPSLRSLVSHKWLNPFSTVLTVSFFSFGLLFFRMNLNEVICIIQKIAGVK